MLFRAALALIIIGMNLVIPITAFASSVELVVVTASPYIGNECVQDFSVVVISDYETQLDWIPGNGTSTLIKGAYGRWPAGVEDGFEVYSGNGSHVSHWLNVDIRILSDLGLYYKVWTDLGNGTYSACYASGSVTGGEGMAEIGANLGALVDYLKLALIFGFPLVLGLIGAKRHSLTLYLCGVIGLGISLSMVGSSLGSAVTIPMFILIVGLLGATVRDAVNRDINII